MNLETINWQAIGSASAVIVFIYGVWRNLKSDLKEKILDAKDHLEEEIENVRHESKNQFATLRTELIEFRAEMNSDYQFLGEQLSVMREDLADFRDEVHSDTSDVKERLSFLEAAMLYTTPIEPVEINPRSKAARDMWQRRKQKRLEKKE